MTKVYLQGSQVYCARAYTYIRTYEIKYKFDAILLIKTINDDIIY